MQKKKQETHKTERRFEHQAYLFNSGTIRPGVKLNTKATVVQKTFCLRKPLVKGVAKAEWHIWRKQRSSFANPWLQHAITLNFQILKRLKEMHSPRASVHFFLFFEKSKLIKSTFGFLFPIKILYHIHRAATIRLEKVFPGHFLIQAASFSSMMCMFSLNGFFLSCTKLMVTGVGTLALWHMPSKFCSQKIRMYFLKPYTRKACTPEPQGGVWFHHWSR